MMGETVSAASKTLARFHSHARLDEAATKEQGRKIFRDEDYIEMRAPGNTQSVVNRPVRDGDAEKFPGAWQAYVSGKGEQIEGTPLSLWPAVTPAQVEELKYLGAHTVEHVAHMRDGEAGNFLGMRALKTKAKQYVRATKSAAPLDELRRENGQLKAQLHAMQGQLDTLVQSAAEQSVAGSAG